MFAPLTQVNKLTLPTRKEGGENLCILSYFSNQKNVYSKQSEGEGQPSRQQRVVIRLLLEKKYFNLSETPFRTDCAKDVVRSGSPLSKETVSPKETVNSVKRDSKFCQKRP